MKRLIFVAALCLSGCNEQAEMAPEVLEVQVDDAIVFVPEPRRQPEPVVEPVEVDDVEVEPEIDWAEETHFSDAKSLERGVRAGKLQRLRALNYLKSFEKQEVKAKKQPYKYDMHDNDFNRWGEHPSDISTYPVDGSRVILETQRISAVLEDEINSQIAGRANVIVDRDVLTADFSKIGIPAGSKMVCRYQPLKKIGETRLGFHCSRIITPKLVSIFLSNPLEGADVKGRTGLIGDVDTRAFQRYGSAFMVASISALSQLGYSKDSESNLEHFGHQFGNQASQITAKLLEENIDITPSVTIKGGTTIMLRLSSDIYLRAPQKIETSL